MFRHLVSQAARGVIARNAVTFVVHVQSAKLSTLPSPASDPKKETKAGIALSALAALKLDLKKMDQAIKQHQTTIDSIVSHVQEIQGT